MKSALQTAANLYFHAFILGGLTLLAVVGALLIGGIGFFGYGMVALDWHWSVKAVGVIFVAEALIIIWAAIQGWRSWLRSKPKPIPIEELMAGPEVSPRRRFRATTWAFGIFLSIFVVSGWKAYLAYLAIGAEPATFVMWFGMATIGIFGVKVTAKALGTFAPPSGNAPTTDQHLIEEV